MSVICPCCQWSIPIGGEAVGCFLIRRRVSERSPPCDKWKKFESMPKTRLAIKQWREENGQEKVSVKMLMTKAQKDIHLAKSQGGYA
jgi:hypothetical protein